MCAPAASGCGTNSSSALHAYIFFALSNSPYYIRNSSYAFKIAMDEERVGTADYHLHYNDGQNELPARYTRGQKQRGGKRRKTTLAKRERQRESLALDEVKLKTDVEPIAIEEPPYKISSEDSSASSVDEDYEIDSIASSIEGALTWRGRMQTSLHAAWFHIIIVVLVITDAIIVIFELLLDVGAFGNLQCEGETRFAQKEFCHYTRHEVCGPPAQLILERLNISASPGSGTGRDGLCICNFRGGQRVCDNKDAATGVNPALVLHVASLLILTLFVIEILLKLIAFRLKYFTHKFEVFDAIIVLLSYILDWASLREEDAFEAASLVIILRLWRVVRIVNGAVLSAKSRSDQQLSEARLKARKIIHAFHKAQDKMDELEEENRKLKKEVAQGKTVHVYRPRGSPQRHHLEAKPATQPSYIQADKEVTNKEKPPERNNDETVDMPDIMITEPEGSDI